MTSLCLTRKPAAFCGPVVFIVLLSSCHSQSIFTPLCFAPFGTSRPFKFDFHGGKKHLIPVVCCSLKKKTTEKQHWRTAALDKLDLLCFKQTNKQISMSGTHESWKLVHINISGKSSQHESWNAWIKWPLKMISAGCSCLSYWRGSDLNSWGCELSSTILFGDFSLTWWIKLRGTKLARPLEKTGCFRCRKQEAENRKGR